MPKKKKFSINKKQISWFIGLTISIIGILWSSIKIYEKSQILFFISIIVVLFLLMIYFSYLLHKKEKSEGKLEKENKKLKDKVKILKNNLCPNCKKVYSHIDETISFDENLRERFSVVDELSDKEAVVYQLEWYVFIDFSLETDINKSYIIDLVNGSIYLPLDDKWESILNGEMCYKIFCSKRENHPGRSKLI